MPIKVPSNLPALDELLREKIFAMDDKRATQQNIRPLEVGILNLMPNKIETELQILRLLSNTPLQINIDLIRIDNIRPKNTPRSHMDAFYHQFSDIEEKNYDGLIVTGAPLGSIEYEDVKYWTQMEYLMDWARVNVQSTLFLCWAAHAALYHFYDLPRQLRKEKLSGVYEHQVVSHTHELLRGFDPNFYAPHSRVGEIHLHDYQKVSELDILATSREAGVYLSTTKNKRMVFVTGHPEYDLHTLDLEYKRDISAGLSPNVPQNYYLDDNPQNNINMRWKSHGNLLFTNWLNYCVYQNTPYDLTQLNERDSRDARR